MPTSPSADRQGFNPPPYPYERLGAIRAAAVERFGSAIDLSIGTPVDPPPAFVPSVLATSERERGYPPSFGTLDLRRSVTEWLHRRFGVVLDPNEVGATVGSKEFIVHLPSYLKLREPSRNVILYPAISYPSYEMGAILAGCEAVPVELDEAGFLSLDSIDPHVANRALLLWVNAPSNPTGRNVGIEEAVKWAARYGVVVASDECYCDFVWQGKVTSALQFSTQNVLAVHSLSKRSNLAGLRVGSYSGDPSLVRFIAEIRKHEGLMVPGPIQSVATSVYLEETHVDSQRRRYLERLDLLVAGFKKAGFDVELPEGGFYLWFKSPVERFRDGFALARFLAEETGMIVSPGEFYGTASSEYVRVATVAPTRVIKELSDRLAGITL